MNQHDFDVLKNGAANPQSERLVDALLIAGAHEDDLIGLIAAIFRRALLDALHFNDRKAVNFLDSCLPGWRSELTERSSPEARQAAAKRHYERRQARARRNSSN